jgi:hypothetical protein
VRNKAANIAVGVDLDDIKHVLGIWVPTSEGARFWAGVCAELANRGIKDVLIADRLVEGQVTASWKRALAQLALAPATSLSWLPRSSPLPPPPLPFCRHGRAEERATKRG